MAKVRNGGLQTPLWQAVAVYRIAALLYLTALAISNARDYQRPALGWSVLALSAIWTLFTSYAYANPVRRRPPLLLADLLVVMAVMASSVFVIGPAGLHSGLPTLAVAWQVAPVIAWAVAGGRRWGIIAALTMGATDLIVRGRHDQARLTGTVLMLLAALAVGFLVRLAEVAEQRLQHAVELESATRERERLARDIHDSVLQVLAMVKRRGAGLTGEAGELARLAGEQEAALRTLMAGHGGVLPPAGELDLIALLAPNASAHVSIAAPAGPVLLPTAVARELGAAVGAALDNVTRHCPANTKVYLLIEDEPDAVTVSVRDEGPGIPAGRLASAEAQGRLGVAQSIRGRIVELGGRVQITAEPGTGTEVELIVPRGSLS